MPSLYLHNFTHLFPSKYKINQNYKSNLKYWKIEKKKLIIEISKKKFKSLKKTFENWSKNLDMKKKLINFTSEK